jgi:TM2 domain-containing membrane protein YozV
MNTKRPSHIPILLSAFACPGAGQFMQKRWMAGVVFVSGFLVGFFWAMVLAIGNIVDYYRMAFDFDYDPDPSSPKAFIAPVMIALVVYVVNLFDVSIAQLRLQRDTCEDLFTTENLAQRNRNQTTPRMNSDKHD